LSGKDKQREQDSMMTSSSLKYENNIFWDCSLSLSPSMGGREGEIDEEEKGEDSNIIAHICILYNVLYHVKYIQIQMQQ